jgi:hypothetical protein
MAIWRHEPGVRAPGDGMYALVGHYGEPTGFAVWCNAGDQLPLSAVAEDVATPLWFVQVGEEVSVRLVA